MCRVLALLIVAACRPASAPPPPPELTVVGESTRLRMEAPRPVKTAWFDGTSVALAAARGETIGFQVVLRTPATVTLSLPATDGITIATFDVDSFEVKRPSTAMYGGSQGRGHYPDVLRASATPGTTTTNPGYFEIVVGPDVKPGVYAGEITTGTRRVQVSLEVAPAKIPPLAVGVWAYGDPRELAWASDPTGDPPRAEPSPAERRCIDMFRAHGILLSPDLHPDWWEARKLLMAGLHDIPVWIPSEPAAAAEAVRGWIERTKGTGMVPFAIPIDEPRSADKQAKLKALAPAVREAGGGAATFRLAVTTDIDPKWGDLIDLYISLYAKRDDKAPRWTYNGAPPHAGSFLLDGVTPGARTWGWIAYRWNISLWYVWDALYWHDRHNRKGAPLPGKPLVATANPVSFDDGGDRGNLDGVLTFPIAGGCARTLRLAAIRRGQQDKALLDRATQCDPTRTEALAARMVPRALGDAPKGSERSWSADESDWERARRELLQLASCER